MFRDACSCLVLAGILRCAVLHADDRHLVVCRSEPPFEARLAGIGADWELRFVAAGETRVLAAEEVAYWGQWTDQTEQTVCLLENGGMLTSSLVGVGDQELVVESQLWHRIVLPRRSVRGLVLQPPLDARERDRLHRRIYAYGEPQDRLWLANGDELTGRLAALPADHGTDLFGLEALYFQLPSAAEPMIIQTRNVIAVALAAESPAVSRPQSSSAYVAFRDGTCLQASTAEQPAGQVVLRLNGDISLVADAGQFFDQITLVQPLHADTVYLSSLEPASYRHVPLLDSNWPLGRDQSVSGGLLRSGGHVYRRGLGMHSTSRVVYELSGEYRQLAAELALDEETGRHGSVVYRVFLESVANGQAATWRRVYESPIVRGGAPSVFMSIDVQKVRRIALVVDFADHGDTLDHADWLNARLVR